MTYLLDTDHLSILQRKAGPGGAVTLMKQQDDDERKYPLWVIVLTAAANLTCAYLVFLGIRYFMGW